MAGHRSWHEIRRVGLPHHQQETAVRANDLAAELFHDDLRVLTEREQIDIAQVTMDRLQQIVGSLGGQLEVAVVYPGGERVPLLTSRQTTASASGSAPQVAEVV